MKNLFDVSGKSVIVTGGSRGIGAMIARGFVENGARVYITARKVPELMEAEKSLSAYGHCVAIPGDLSTVEGITAFTDAIVQHETGIDVLVNNAGAAWGAPIDSYPESGWDKVMDLNVKSIFYMIQKCLPGLRRSANAQDPARVINIASINGITNPKADNYAYSASKAAVIQLTRHMAADLAKENIVVNGIAPGFFPSRMTAFMMDNGGDELVAKATPLGRVGQPEDAAGTAIYLASRASAWVTGHTIVLDGGMVAQAG